MVYCCLGILKGFSRLPGNFEHNLSGKSAEHILCMQCHSTNHVTEYE